MFNSFIPFAAVTSLLLASNLPARADFRSDEARIAPIKSVGIISIVGDRLTLEEAGLTTFSPVERKVDIRGWDLDTTIERQTAALLRSSFNVVALRRPTDAFAASEESSSIPLLGLFREDAITSVLRELKRAAPADAYVVVLKANSPTGLSNKSVQGLGVLEFHSATETYARLHALYEVQVFDGQTLDLLEGRAAAPIDQDVLPRLAGPSRAVEKNLIASNDLANDTTLRTAVMSLIAHSLPQTLRDLHLTDRP